MSSKSSGIGLGGILFWGFIMYQIFGGGDDEKDTKVEVVDTDNKSITDTIKDKVNEIAPEVEKLVSNAKKGLQEIKEDIQEQKPKEETKIKKEPKKESTDRFAQDDIYGDDDNKW